jgi:hypothetical protein
MSDWHDINKKLSASERRFLNKERLDLYVLADRLRDSVRGATWEDEIVKIKCDRIMRDMSSLMDKINHIPILQK